MEGTCSRYVNDFQFIRSQSEDNGLLASLNVYKRTEHVMSSCYLPTSLTCAMADGAQMVSYQPMSDCGSRNSVGRIAIP